MALLPEDCGTRAWRRRHATQRAHWENTIEPRWSAKPRASLATTEVLHRFSDQTAVMVQV